MNYIDIRILLVEDGNTNSSVKSILENIGFHVELTNNYREFSFEVVFNHIDLVIVNDNFKDTFDHKLLNVFCEIPVIYISSEKSLEEIIAIMQNGANDYISNKLVDEAILLQSINKVFDLIKRLRFNVEQRNNYFILLDTLPDIVLIFQDFNITYFNKAVEHVTGYNDIEINQPNFLSTILSVEHIQVIKESFESRMLGKQIEDYEVNVQCKNGKTINVIVRGKLITHNNRPATLVVLIDITQQKEYERYLFNKTTELEIKSEEIQSQNEELSCLNEELSNMNDQLRQSEEKFSAMFLSMQEGCVLYELIYDNSGVPIDYLIVNANPAFEVLTGIKLNKYINLSASKIFSQTPPPYLEIFAKVAETGNPEKFEDFFDAIRKYVSLSVFSPIKGRFVTIFTDITDKKISDAALKEKTKELDTYFNVAIDLLCIAHIDGYFLRLNNQWAITLGYSLRELMDTSFIDFVHLEDRELAKSMLDELRSNHQISNLVIRFMRKDKELRWIEWNAHQIGNLIYVAARDITERKQFENDLKASHKKAQEADRLKSAFLANMSHEIRTPLNTIIGFTNLLKSNKSLDEESSKFLEIISNGGSILLNLINDIIDLSKIEANEIRIVDKKCNIIDLLKDLHSFFYSDMIICKGKAEVSLNLHLPLEYENHFILTDEIRLKQILTNLLSNAIKFTSSGSIDLGFKLLTESNELLFFVKDTGIGIEEKNINTIFERFRQADDTVERKFGGTGLGLTISMNLVKLMKGRIWVESEIGKGSTFNFTIPLHEAKNSTILKVENINSIDRNWENKLFVIAEDDFNCFLFIDAVIKKTGASVLRANNGKEALELCVNNSPDIVLMDMQMPIMNGYDASLEIKKIKPNLPVIAVTANVFAEDQEKCFINGCNDYISKPIDVKLLYKTIEKYFNYQ